MAKQTRQLAASILSLLNSADPEQIAYGQDLAQSLDSDAVYRRLFSGLQRDASGTWSMRWSVEGTLRRKARPWRDLSEAEQGCFWALVDMLAQRWGGPAAVDFTPADLDVLLGMSSPWPPELVAWFWQRWMVPVPAGTFDMSLPRVRGHKGPNKRTIQISRGFSVMRTPVTQWVYTAVMHHNPSQFPLTPRARSAAANYPVDSVSWYDAVDFCQRLSERLGCPPGYTLDQGIVYQHLHAGFRLPTRAEWTHFAMAGETHLYAGGADPEAVSWSRLNAKGTTHPVGQLPPNALGLHDVSGNVFEWCWDWYKRRHRYGRVTNSAVVDPCGPSGGYSRMRCGGSWRSNPWVGRVQYSHTGADPLVRDSRNGLRPICVVPPSGLHGETSV